MCICPALTVIFKHHHHHLITPITRKPAFSSHYITSIRLAPVNPLSSSHLSLAIALSSLLSQPLARVSVMPFVRTNFTPRLEVSPSWNSTPSNGNSYQLLIGGLWLVISVSYLSSFSTNQICGLCEFSLAIVYFMDFPTPNLGLTLKSFFASYFSVYSRSLERVLHQSRTNT